MSAVLAIALLLLLGRPGGEPSPADDPLLKRLAAVSPPVLLDAPGWRVERTDEQAGRTGSTQFFRGRPITPPYSSQRIAELRWYATETPTDRIRFILSQPRRIRQQALRRGLHPSPSAVREVGGAPVLGERARIFFHPLEGNPSDEVIAVWSHRGKTFVFRSFVADGDPRALPGQLADLHEVEPKAWLEALDGATVSQHKGGVLARQVMPWEDRASQSAQPD